MSPPSEGRPVGDQAASENPATDHFQHNGHRPAVQRTIFATPRAAEFLELRALQAQTGQAADAFGDVVIKELLDNALDGAESAGRAPVIEIGTRTEDGIVFVTVTDNGAGITPNTVERIRDFTVLVSDKARTVALPAAPRAMR